MGCHDAGGLQRCLCVPGSQTAVCVTAHELATLVVPRYRRYRLQLHRNECESFDKEYLTILIQMFK